MGKCNVCGKKGLFLRVNVYGRCKQCDERIKKEEHLKLQKEEEERNRRAAEREKERLEREKAKMAPVRGQLYEILDMLILLDTELYLVITAKCEKFLPIIDERIKQCDQLKDMVRKADKTPYFIDALKEYAYSETEEEKYDLLGIKQKIKNYIECSFYDPKFAAHHCFFGLALEFDEAWKKEKKEVKKYLKNIEKEERAYEKEIREIDAICEGIEEDETLVCDIGEAMRRESFDFVPDCVVTDIETSGLIYNKNSIIEIAAIKIVDSKVVGTYSSLVHRDKPLDKKITLLTGITTQMLRNCNKSLDMVMSEYKEFINDLPLVGHNIKSFDIKFINEAYLKTFGKEITNLCIDTLKMSHEHFYDENSHKLGDLAKAAGIPEGTQHRALGDCETTAWLYKFMVDEAAFLLLRWGRKGKEIDETNATYPKILKRQYPAGMCYKYHQKLVECGYLKRAGVSDILNTLTVSELKDILEKNSLSSTGSKAVLVDRIVNESDTRMLNLPIKYVLSQKGIEYFENIIKKKNDKYFSYIENKQYGLARSEILNISEMYKDLGNMKEYYFYLLCVFYHDMSGFNNGGWQEDRIDLIFAPAIIHDIEKKSKYYEENMVERCFTQYKLPSHYLTQSELSGALSKLFSEGAEAMKEVIING